MTAYYHSHRFLRSSVQLPSCHLRASVREATESFLRTMEERHGIISCTYPQPVFSSIDGQNRSRVNCYVLGTFYRSCINILENNSQVIHTSPKKNIFVTVLLELAVIGNTNYSFGQLQDPHDQQNVIQN